MKKTTKRLFSWILALTMLVGTAMPVAAADADVHTHTHTHEVVGNAAEDTQSAVNSQQASGTAADEQPEELESFTYSGLETLPLLMNTDDVVIDETDPAILTFATELREIKVLNAEGESVPLTEEQIQTVLGMYQQYLGHWAENADVLGVQLPFFLQYNDNGEDGLGILGEMLALAGVPVDAVRAGQMSYDDLTGMIQNFMFGDSLGVALYGDAIRAARDEVLALIESSGAKTEAQKLLILNDWIAHVDTFDMPYIMNNDKEPGVDAGTMIAEDPQPHMYEQVVYDQIYGAYYDQIEAQFKSQIREGLTAAMRQSFYEGAIENIVYQAAYNEYLNVNHEHVLTGTFEWLAMSSGAPTATVVVVCEACRSEEPIYSGAAEVALDAEASVAATCTATGTEVYVASVSVTSEALGLTDVVVTSDPYTVGVAIDPLNHAGAPLNASVADWSGATVDVTVSCSACSASAVAAGVEVTEHIDVAETCTADGSKTLTAAGSISDEATGLTGDYSVSTTAVIPAAHKFNSNEVCTECGATSDVHVHTLAETAVFTWAEDGYTATADIACTTCSNLAVDDQAAVITDAVTTAPTCTEPGVRTYTATLNVAVGEDIKTYTSTKDGSEAATGHNWVGEYSWNVDGAGNPTATADFRCDNDNNGAGCNAVVEGETADNVVSHINSESTCTVPGTVTYTATFETEIGTFTAEKTENLPLAAHTTSENSADFSWEADGTDGYTATAVVYCDVCGNNITDSIAATVSGPVTVKEASCYEAGSESYTATITATINGSEETFTETAEYATPATNNHIYDEDGKCTTEGCTAIKPEEIIAVASLVDMMEGESAEEKTPLQMEAEAYANAAADQYMSDNADAISADPAAFVEANFGPDAAAQVAAQWEYFWADCEANGIPQMTAPTEENPEGRVPMDAIIEQQMNTPMADLPQKGVDENGNPVHMTPNEAIPVYADQAAVGLTDGVLNYWEGTQFGALAGGTSVCLGYAKAFAYLVQCMHPEIYGVNGADTDMTKAENWKAAKDLYYAEDGTTLDISTGYTVDLVRVTFDASVTMFGETQDNFNSDHFWNAVLVDGQWYYVDPCYTDVFTEVMIRDRVETDGSMNHLYFMFSHDSAVSMYDGNYKEIKTLYDTAANATDYEDSWMSRVKSNVYSDGQYFYYIYDSTDMLTMIEDQQQSSKTQYKLVRHKITNTDAGTNGDTDYETLIDFTYQPDEDSDSYVLIYDTAGREFTKEYADFVNALYEEHKEAQKIYPSIALTAALYDGKVYFNLANCILSYDLSDGTVKVVKEYNTVHALRDKTNPFGGMAFSVVDSAEEATFTVENHPLAGLTIKNDGKMYVSVATNFAYISGNKSQTSYGYVYEESNYNPNYNTYNTGDYDDSMLEQYGYTKEVNDNDEFMWAANFVETLDMSHFGGAEHTYEAVSVDASCGVNAYTENRCTTCGVIEAGSRVEEADTAREHHFIYFEETYYTKDDSGNVNTGFCYVCAECGFHIDEPTEPSENADYSSSGTTYEEQYAIYQEELKIYEAAAASAGHKYTADNPIWAEDNSTVTFSALVCANDVCAARENSMDIYVDNGSMQYPSLTLDSAATYDAAITGYEGDCTDVLYAIYSVTDIVTNRYGDFEFTVSKTVEVESEAHTYEAAFLWEEVVDEETGEITYTASANMMCSYCGDIQESVPATVVEDTESYVAPTCTEEGQRVFTAKAILYAEDGETVLADLEETKTFVLAALGHDFSDWTAAEDGENHTRVCSVCEETETEAHSFGEWASADDANHNRVCSACGAEETAAHEFGEGVVTKEATCTEDGVKTYSCTACDYSYTEAIAAAGHDYKDGICENCGADASVDLTAPEILSCYSKVQTSVKVTWSVVDGADGYELWRATAPDAADEEWKRVKTVSNGATDRYTNQFSADEIGITFYYAVRAYRLNAEGERVYSDFSAISYMPAAVVWNGPVAPGVPYSNSTSRIRLLWQEVSGAHGYQIWRQDADGNWAIVKTLGDKGNVLTDNQGATTAYSNTGLTAGETYTYKMRAFMITEDGKKVFGAYSDEYSVAVMPEVTEMTLSSDTAGRALVAWTAVNGAAGYQIWMADAEDGNYKIVKSITDGSTSYTKHDLESGETYFFKIRAYSEVEGRKTFGAYTEVGSVVIK